MALSRFGSLLLVNVALFLGCSCQTNEPRQVPPAPPAVADDLTPPADPLLQPAPATDDLASETEDPLIRSFGQLFDSSPVFRDQDDLKSGLRTSLREADQALTRVRRENQQALRQMNRQVRLRGRNSPNLILVTVRGMSRELMGCYGGSPDATPNIDRLAAAGVCFERYNEQAPSDSRSELSLMTGRRDTLPGKSLPSLMWYAGYTTALIGECSLAGVVRSDPRDIGFDEWFGIQDPDGTAAAYPEYAMNNGARIRLLGNSDGQREVTASELFTREAVAYLQRRATGRPFFLWLAYTLPSGSSEALPNDMRQLDAHVGQLFDGLRQAGIAGNTIIMLTSYGATPTGTPERPLILYAPTRIAGGDIRWDGDCGAWDILPTALDMIGALHRPRAIDGVSLLPQLKKAGAAAKAETKSTN